MIRVFVGCAPNHEDAESQAVFEWSLRKYSSLPVEITWMKMNVDQRSPFYGWNTTDWATPFTAFRWAVPYLCNFNGRAIYSDSDFIFKADIAELWNKPFESGKIVMSKTPNRTCLIMWNCELAKDHILPFDELRSRTDTHSVMRKYLVDHPNLVQKFDRNWNCLDGENYDDLNDSDIAAIHYTHMKSQPHLSRASKRLAKENRQHWFDGEFARHWRNDLIDLFETMLKEAEQNGYTVTRYTQDPIYGEYKKRSVGGIGRPSWAFGRDKK